MSEFNNLLDIVAQLRKECPWDKEQTHESLAKHLIEESYELLDVLSNLDDSQNKFNELKEELGDLLLQILLHSEIASEKNYFSIIEVINSLQQKGIKCVFAQYEKTSKNKQVKDLYELFGFQKIKCGDVSNKYKLYLDEYVPSIIDFIKVSLQN